MGSYYKGYDFKKLSPLIHSAGDRLLLSDKAGTAGKSQLLRHRVWGWREWRGNKKGGKDSRWAAGVEGEPSSESWKCSHSRGHPAPRVALAWMCSSHTHQSQSDLFVWRLQWCCFSVNLQSFFVSPRVIIQSPQRGQDFSFPGYLQCPEIWEEERFPGDVGIRAHEQGVACTGMECYRCSTHRAALSTVGVALQSWKPFDVVVRASPIQKQQRALPGGLGMVQRSQRCLSQCFLS